MINTWMYVHVFVIFKQYVRRAANLTCKVFRELGGRYDKGNNGVPGQG